jgi:membrane-bound lytic murein transglycosylase B
MVRHRSAARILLAVTLAFAAGGVPSRGPAHAETSTVAFQLRRRFLRRWQARHLEQRPDVLASIANYLNSYGWDQALPWDFEVRVPRNFDCRRSRDSFADWARLGLRRSDGEDLPDRGDGILFFPSGAAGPAFLITQNFVVIKRYNDSDIYALAALHLGDRIHGGGPVRAAWPADDRQLTRDERIALQRKLAALGYSVRDFEGRVDFDLRDAIRELQAMHGMRPDGHPTEVLLERLGIK